VAHQPLAAVLGQLIGMVGEQADTPPYPLMPSPTFAHSSSRVNFAEEPVSENERGACQKINVNYETPFKSHRLCGGIW
jgi:hypothetical protein